MEKRRTKLAADRLIYDTGFIPKTATEIEFYISDIGSIPAEYDVKDEDGDEQYEITFSPENPLVSAKHIVQLKQILQKGVFLAKPYPDQPASGLHVHITLHDNDGKNLYEKSNGRESDVLLWSIGGLMESMPESMVFFAPNPDSYKRFTENDRHNVPLKIAWGGNNRTVPLRIPNSSPRRIEHRVAGADANPYDVLTEILNGIHHGITNNIFPPQKIHGNAFDKQYNLMNLIKN